MNNYPDDTEFYERQITRVNKGDKGYDIGMDSMGCFLDAEHGVEPAVGQTIRFYGREYGAFRGIYIDGVRAFYRTQAEDKEHNEVLMYGADAADWLKRWDEGRSVWSIEMGGLGPGYEQCIHITAAEVLRILLAEKPDVSLWEDKDIWRRQVDAIDKTLFAIPFINKLGLSGAQHGAAVSLAVHLYREGPRGVMSNARVKDRHIQVEKNFPLAA